LVKGYSITSVEAQNILEKSKTFLFEYHLLNHSKTSPSQSLVAALNR